MDFAAQVKAAVDIVGVVGQYVRLKRVGSTQSYTGLCPFHNEKTPSFRVHSNHQYYKCFGCGAGGDVFKFVMEIDRLSFFEALKLLAEKHGIPMPKRSDYADADTRLRAAIYQMHEMAAERFSSALRSPAGAEARAYLAKRGVRDEVIAYFGLGYSERGGQMLVRLFESQFSAEPLEASGLVMKRQDSSGWFDRFRNRLMFPIHNESGKVIGFGGRALSDEDQPKYLNSPETSIYHKSYVLYNLHRAKDPVRKDDRAVLVEGYMDVIGVVAAGVGEVVASCGTALTTQQVQSLKRHSQRIVVNFDPDAAGARASERSIQMLLEEGMHVRVLELPGSLDPDEFCKERGAEAYRALLDRAPGYFTWLADRARQRFDMRTAEGRVGAFQFLLPAIHRLTDKIERMAVANEVATHLGVDQGLVLENFRKAAAERREANMPAPPPDPETASEKKLLSLLLANEEARESLVPRLKDLRALGQLPTRRIFAALIALHESGGPFGFSELDARLEDADKERMAAIVFSEENVTVEEGEGCILTLRLMDYEEEIGAMKQRIKEAERSGRFEDAMRLMGDLDRLEQSRRPGVVQ